MLAVTHNPFIALTFIVDIILDNVDPMTDFMMAFVYFRQVIKAYVMYTDFLSHC